MFSAASWSRTRNHVTPPAITMIAPTTMTIVANVLGPRLPVAMSDSDHLRGSRSQPADVAATLNCGDAAGITLDG